MGIRSISIINEGLPFLAHPLNKGMRLLFTRVREKEQLRGAGARNRDRTLFWFGRELVQYDIKQIR